MMLSLLVYSVFALALVFFSFNAGVDHGRSNLGHTVFLRRRSMVRKATTTPLFVTILFLCGFVAMTYAQ